MMRTTIWVLLVLAIIAVAWEYYKPAPPQGEIIASVSTVTIPKSKNAKNTPPADTDATGTVVADNEVDEDALPEPPSAPLGDIATAGSAVDSAPAGADVYTLTSPSKVEWIGRKIGGQHNGTVEISGGDIWVQDGETIVGGQIELDMTTLMATDSPNESLDNHLKSQEYFGVDFHPRATFAFVGYEAGKITGILTLKGISKQIEFPASVSVEDDNVIANARFALDRTEWGIKGGVPAISQYMEISFSLVWQPSN